MFSCKALPISDSVLPKTPKQEDKSADFLRAQVTSLLHTAILSTSIPGEANTICICWGRKKLSSWLGVAKRWSEFRWDRSMEIGALQLHQHRNEQQQQECWSQQHYREGSVWAQVGPKKKCTQITKRKKKGKNINQVMQHSLGHSLQL